MISLTVVLRPQRKFLAQRVKHPPGVVGFGDCLSHNHVRNPQPHLMSNTFLLIYDCQRFALRPLPPPLAQRLKCLSDLGSVSPNPHRRGHDAPTRRDHHRSRLPLFPRTPQELESGLNLSWRHRGSSNRQTAPLHLVQ